jgi:hypothetical protein
VSEGVGGGGGELVCVTVTTGPTAQQTKTCGIADVNAAATTTATNTPPPPTTDVTPAPASHARTLPSSESTHY